MTLLVANTSLSHDAFHGYCDEPNLHQIIDADCGGDDPEVPCACCATCCVDESASCETNLPVVCDMTRKQVESNDYRGRTCQCDEFGRTLTCSERCESCSFDGSVCATAVETGFEFEDEGAYGRFWTTWEYTKGRVGTVRFEQTPNEQGMWVFEVFVNGEQCNVAYGSVCGDQFSTIHVNCDNVDGAGTLDMCSGEVAEGLLAIFSLQDVNLVRGDSCRPIVWDYEMVNEL